MDLRNAIGLLFLLLILTGCSHLTALKDGQRPQAWLEPGVRVELPLPGIFPNIQAQQMLTATFNDDTQSLMVMLDADDTQLTLAGLSPLGIRLFLIQYDESGVQVEQSIVLPKAPPVSQILADVMLGLWPLAAWQAQLPTGWHLDDGDTLRSLYNAKGKLISEIHYQNEYGVRKPIMIKNYQFNYQIQIQDLEN